MGAVWALLVVAAAAAATRNDAVLVTVPVTKTDPVTSTREWELVFKLRYSNVSRWREAIRRFCDEGQVNVIERLESIVEAELHRLKLLPEPSRFSPSTTSLDTTRTVLAASFQRYKQDSLSSPTQFFASYFLSNKALALAHRSAAHGAFVADIRAAVDYSSLRAAVKPRMSASLPSFLLAQLAPITVLQSREAFTGGTTAMRILSTSLSALGFRTQLCNDSNANASPCNSFHPHGLVVTGEWCNEVLANYSAGRNAYRGRGLQYVLGFHHGRDQCRGWPSVAHSHYLQASLSRHSISAFFLGCPMAEPVEEAVLQLLHDALFPHIPPIGAVQVFKEDRLFVVDPDYFDFYVPETRQSLRMPDGASAVRSERLAPEAMLNLLQRARATLDLAMPGAERLSSEAILFGAVPVVSRRWNGASSVDFPLPHKVDALDGDQVSQMVAAVFHSPLLETLARSNHIDHYLSVLSMWRKLTHTADAVFSSMGLSFVVVAQTQSEEAAVVMQTLALLHLFPLASVALVVRDCRWFQRHFYLFWDMMRQSGYVWDDPFHPQEMGDRGTAAPSQVSVHHVDELRTTGAAGVAPSWPALTVRLPVGTVLRSPKALLGILRGVTPASVLCIDAASSDGTCATGLVAGPAASQLELAARAPSREVLGPSSSTVHVHHLLSAGGHCAEHSDLVCGVRQQSLWSTLQEFLDEVDDPV